MTRCRAFWFTNGNAVGVRINYTLDRNQRSFWAGACNYTKAANFV